MKTYKDKLICGDSIKIMKEMPDDSFDLIVTDPPYNAVNRKIGKMRSCRTMDKKGADSAPIDIPYLAKEFTRLCKKSIYIWCSTEQAGIWRDELTKNNLTTRQCVWVRTNPSPLNGDKMWLSGMELCIFARKPKATFNRFCQLPAWYGPAQRVKGFPCPKPVWLMEEIIDASSHIDDLVLDPFMGSGSTILGCMKLKRKYCGIEMDKGYFHVAQERIKDYKVPKMKGALKDITMVDD